MFAQQRGCKFPPRRPTRDPTPSLYYKIQVSRSAEAFKIFSFGEAMHRKYGPTYREPTLVSTTMGSNV